MEPEEKKSTSALPAMIILLVILIACGIFFILQLKNRKKEVAARPDPDADYSDEEDEFPFYEETDSGEPEDDFDEPEEESF